MSLIASALLLLGSLGATPSCASGQGCSMGQRGDTGSAVSDAHACCAQESVRAEAACCRTEVSDSSRGCPGSMSSEPQPTTAGVGASSGPGVRSSAWSETAYVDVDHGDQRGLVGTKPQGVLLPARIARAPLFLIDAALLI